MKIKILHSGVVLVLLLSLSACTEMLWSTSGGVFSGGKELTRKEGRGRDVVKKDQLLGFVQIKAPSDHEQAQLLIVGREYAYPLSAGQEQAQQIINSGLDVKYWRAVTSGQGEDSDINLYFKDNQKDPLAFTMRITLSYEKPALTERELQVLTQLGAKPIDAKNQQGEKLQVYAKEIQFEGHVQGLNQQLRALDYQKFSHNYSIVMYSPLKQVTRINYGPLLRQTALTPFTVVGDIILLPLYAFIFLFGH